MQIKSIHARQIIDSRDNPTVEVDVELDDGALGRAAVPSGASTGEHEALELRDGDPDKYHGKGVLKAVNHVNDEIATAFVGKDFESQVALDEALVDLDSTENKSNLGANAILGVSMAFLVAVAKSMDKPVYRLIADIYEHEPKLPRPMFNIMNGGKHAEWSTDVQEFMVIPMKYDTWAERLEVGSEIFIQLQKILESEDMSVNVGNEGGFAPHFESNEQAFEYVLRAIEESGYKPGEDVGIGLDIAASEFYKESMMNDSVAAVHYELKTEGKLLTPDEWLARVKKWMQDYPLVSVEDPFDQDDWEFWGKLQAQLTDTKVEQLVGDDLLVTNTDRIQLAIEKKACNALLVKLNQIGTVSETLAAMHMAEQAGWKNIVSHRSGETEDVFIAHLAVGTGAGQIKSGAPSRGERTAKYNELLRIEEKLKANG